MPWWKPWAEVQTMAEKSSLLVLRLEGAMQSWGDGSKWDDRDSTSMPSKSGIVGLLACAMGLEREDTEIAALSEAISVTVRADRPGTKAVDFQTVTTLPGYHLQTANGGRRSSGDTIISRRTYLQDASFLVVIAAEPIWHERIITALKAPKWCVCLGRKNCVPSRPVLECEAPVERDLLKLIRTYPVADRAVYPMIFETDVPLSNAVSYTKPDERRPGDRSFVRRTVWRGIIEEDSHVSDEN